jgi:cytochrome c5
MQEHDQHVSPIKSPRQLVIVVALAFIVPIALIVLLSQLVTGGPHGRNEGDPRVLSRIQAFGNVVMADASGPKGNLSGEAVYGQVCKTCHEAGLAGAPKTGDKVAWTARLAQGQATLVKNAIAGFQGKAGVMPPKGGNADLTDAEVRRAVVHMANLAGTRAGKSRWRSPQRRPRPWRRRRHRGPSTAPVAVAAGAAPAAAADGKKVYESSCIACHGAGIAGAPKFGDKAAWAPRIAQGVNTLHTHAIAGFTGKGGMMPPKGGNAMLSDADVKAAVDYMVSAAK